MWEHSKFSICYLTSFNRSSGKTNQFGLHRNWKEKVQASSESRIQPPSITTSESTAARYTQSQAQPQALKNLRHVAGHQAQAPNGPNPVSDEDDPEQRLGGELGIDENEELLTAVRNSSVVAKRNHKGGTKGVSYIKLPSLLIILSYMSK